MPVPTSSGDPRHSPDADRASAMVDIDLIPATILGQKIVDENTPGTRGDETGIAAEIIRRQHSR